MSRKVTKREEKCFIVLMKSVRNYNIICVDLTFTIVLEKCGRYSDLNQGYYTKLKLKAPFSLILAI